jgi:hypothetical protein
VTDKLDEIRKRNEERKRTHADECDARLDGGSCCEDTMPADIDYLLGEIERLTKPSRERNDKADTWLENSWAQWADAGKGRKIFMLWRSLFDELIRARGNQISTLEREVRLLQARCSQLLDTTLHVGALGDRIADRVAERLAQDPSNDGLD